MSNKILVTYASRIGSTASVAEAIGQTLIDSGAEVEVRRITTSLTSPRIMRSSRAAPFATNSGSRKPPSSYRSVKQPCAQKPFAAFLVCMTLAMKNGENYRPHVATFLDPIRVVVRPVSEGLFAGALDISKIPSFSDRLKFRLSVIFGVWKEGDHRDWPAIRAWAASLHPLLQSM